MSRTIKIAALQQDIIPGDPHENQITTAHNLNRISRDTDLVVIPELFTTGNITDRSALSLLAQSNSDNTMDDVHRWADYFGFAIAGSFLATDDGHNYFNRGFFVEPGGDEYFYDKRHLFSLSTEKDLLTAGNKISPVIRYRGWNIKLFICYDLRFPVWCKKRDNEFDIMLFPANWPEARIYQFKQLLSARAIENNAIVVGCNRIGKDEYGDYPADASGIYDLLGRDVSSRDQWGNLYASFDYDEFNSRRTRFATWRDSDNFSISLD